MGDIHDKTLEELIEALAASGHMDHGTVCDYGEAVNCPALNCAPGPCECGADSHNAAVDARLADVKAKLDEMRLDARGDAFDRDRG